MILNHELQTLAEKQRFK